MREQFIEAFLAQVLPPQYRFGTGEGIDRAGDPSGQLDVVVEFPFFPSLPIPGQATSRQYIAEGIAAVIEVKSDAANQWDQVIEKADQVNELDRRILAQIVFMQDKAFQVFYQKVPFFVAAYTGWKDPATVVAHLQDAPVHGVLIIDPGIFVSAPSLGSLNVTGPWSLWAFISCLHRCTQSLFAAYVDLMDYASPLPKPNPAD